MARGLFRIKIEEGLYHPCSENEGADQLRGYNREADLRLCFRICKKPVFSQHGSYNSTVISIIFHTDRSEQTVYRHRSDYRV